MAKKQKGFDPVEAAKVSKPTSAVAQPAPVATPDVIVPPPPPPVQPPVVTAQAAPPAPPVVLAPSKTGRYRVVKTKQISMHGCITKLVAGDIIVPANYGPTGHARLLEQKVELEPID